MLTDKKTSTLPQREAIRTHRFYLDAAFALHWRSQNSTVFAAWFWADKSPQGGRQWLLSFMQFVRSFDDLKRAGEAVNALALGNYGSSDGQQSVQDLTTIVCKCLDRHNNVPGALASAKESLVYEVSTFLNQLRLESESNMALQNLLGKVLSFTVDLGEVSLPDPQHNSFEDWMESWEVEEVKPQNSGGGLEEDDGQDHDDPGNAGHAMEPGDGCVHDGRPAADLPQAAECNEASIGLKYLFRIAIPIIDVLHIVDTMTFSFLHKLSNWDWFLTLLIGICDMLCNPWTRERFLEQCLNPDPVGKTYAHMFEKQFHSIIEWRWKTVVRVLTWLIPLRHRFQTKSIFYSLFLVQNIIAVEVASQ